MTAPVRVSLGGARVDLLTRDALVEAVGERLLAPGVRPLFVISANLDHVHHFGDGGGRTLPAPTTPAAEWLVAVDGMPLVWTARRMTGLSWEQLAGSDVLPILLTRASHLGVRLGVLGGGPAMHAALGPLLAARYPGIVLAGTWSPCGAEVEDPETGLRLADEIRAAGVDLLVTSIAKPRQEEWLARAGVASGCKVALAFGAALDFLTGQARRAPAGWTRLGLEWLYRLLAEPRRLYQRYLVRGPRDVATLLRSSRLGP